MNNTLPLPPMWAESIDQRTGRTYYYHILTSERTFERPLHTYDKKLAEEFPSTSTTTVSSSDYYNTNYASNGTVTTGSTMSNSGDKLTAEVRETHKQPYAYYTEEYRFEKEKAHSEQRKHKKDKKKRKDEEDDDDDDDTYGENMDSYSTDESDDRKRHHREHHRRVNRSSKKAEKRQLNALFGPLTAAAASSSTITTTSHASSKSEKQMRSSESGSGNMSPPNHRHSKPSRPDVEDDIPDLEIGHQHLLSNKSSRRTSPAPASKSSKKTKLQDKAVAVAGQEEDNHSRRSKSKSKSKSTHNNNRSVPTTVAKPTKINKPAATTSTTSTAKSEKKTQQDVMAAQFEKTRQELEARKKELIKKEKELEMERKAIQEQRKQEEQARMLQAALDEQERKRALERDVVKRRELDRKESLRRVSAAEEQARILAREAQEARRQAEQDAARARQRAAELDAARLQAEKEAQRAKQKAALEEEARLQAVQEVERVLQASKALKDEQAMALEEAGYKVALAEEKRMWAERKMIEDEQSRLQEALQRQETEAQLAKQKAAFEEEARRQAVLEVEQVRQAAKTQQEEQVRALKEAEYKMRVAEEKQMQAERKPMDEEQGRREEEQKRQELERSLLVADLAKSDVSSSSASSNSASSPMANVSNLNDDSGDDDSDNDDSSSLLSGPSSRSDKDGSASYDESSSEEITLRDDAVMSNKNPAVTSYVMEDSMDLADLVDDDDEFELTESNAKSRVARENKRQLEKKYSSSVDTSSTKNSSSLPGRDTSYQNSNVNSASILSFGGASELRYRRERSPTRRTGRSPSPARAPRQPTRSVSPTRSPTKGKGLSPSSRSPRQPTRSVSPTRSPTKTRLALMRSSSADPSRRMKLERVKSRPGMGSMSASMDFRNATAKKEMAGFNPHESRLGPVRGISRMQSVAAGRGAMSRAQSGRGIGARTKSLGLTRAQSRPNMERSRSKGSFDGNRSISTGGFAPVARKKKRKLEYEKPPRSLVLIWLVVMGELGFDLGTTVISFKHLTEEDNCCGEPIALGPVPMSMTIPFFCLVAAEITLLVRAILLTLFPNIMQDPEEDDRDKNGNLIVRSMFMKCVCCCLRWKVRLVMKFLSFLVVLNPFFGCFIAWILLYQSNKKSAFMVLGFEGGALLLHYVSVYLEGGINSCMEFLMQGLLPLIPFSVGIGLVMFYLKQGGVCYIVADQLFKFNGCEVCANGYPPDANGTCYFTNGTSYMFEPDNIFQLETISSIDGLLARTYQVSYCAYENPGGPDTNFCFFDFERGKLDGIVSNSTGPPSTNATQNNNNASTNKCGGTAGVGNSLTNCRKLLWDPTGDDSLHCFTFGGEGDPCHLSMNNDGENEGRFKDPSQCGLEIVDGGNLPYGDTFYLWNEPNTFDKSYEWAGNSWLAYSSARWTEQVKEMRIRGVRVSTPLVRYDDAEQLRAHMVEFFDACKPGCLDPEDPSYIDVLAAQVFCDPDVEVCAEKAAAATEALAAVSKEFDSRPVHITSWGVLDTEDTSTLMQAMDATPAFFKDGSPVERVYWYGGNTTDSTNLSLQPVEGQGDSSLGQLWVQECNAFR